MTYCGRDIEYLGTPDLTMRALGVYLGLHLYRLLLKHESLLGDPPRELLDALERADLKGVPLQTFLSEPEEAACSVRDWGTGRALDDGGRRRSVPRRP